MRQILQTPLHRHLRRGARSVALAGALSVAVAPLSVLPLLAGEGAVDYGPVFVPGKDPVFTTVPTGPKKPGTTTTPTPGTPAAIVNELNLAREFCSLVVQKEYVIDCLADELNRVADSIPVSSDYAPARDALKSASRKLSAIVEDNRSTTLPAGIARSKDPEKPRTSSRPLRAVETDKLAEASAEASAVIEETGTILLRSSDQSDEAEGYVAISEAVTSTTVLLRSL